MFLKLEKLKESKLHHPVKEVGRVRVRGHAMEKYACKY